MEAELIAVSGALMGARFALGAELRIGRAPSSEIRLTDSDAAWEHAVVRLLEGRYHIMDRRTGSGTYVNGMRASEHCLTPGDQVSIGETVFVYSEDGPVAAQDSQHHTLLRACSLLFLFRALALSQNNVHRGTLEGQIVRLMADIVPCQGGAVLLGHDPDELRCAARAVSAPLDLVEVMTQVWRDGAEAYLGMCVAGFPNLLGELLRRGYSDDDVRAIAGGNILRVMRRAEAAAARLGRERGPSEATIEELDGGG